MQFFNTAEGYVEPVSAGSTNFVYVFQYKDHPSASLRAGLGNIRLFYADADGNGIIAQTEIREENNYYPFGLKHKGYNNVVTSTNPALKYKFQGQELEESLGLDMYEFELRHYDASIGRFVTTDPFEQFDSPYVAMGNNPIVSFDPDGGYCLDANGNQVACPDDAGDFYDEYKDSETNHITLLDEVEVTNSLFPTDDGITVYGQGGEIVDGLVEGFDRGNGNVVEVGGADVNAGYGFLDWLINLLFGNNSQPPKSDSANNNEKNQEAKDEEDSDPEFYDFYTYYPEETRYYSLSGSSSRSRTTVKPKKHKNLYVTKLKDAVNEAKKELNKDNRIDSVVLKPVYNSTKDPNKNKSAKGSTITRD
ncbi:MAG: RHS repeat-associated core domain-containing protein [Flavobacteriaceae bacterium]|nr:RHS repeat-associated core domain-containing protein [Flavobacteriaceae bacterium]